MRKIKEFELVREWARERGLYDFGNVPIQTMKMTEELGEFSKAYLKHNKEDMVDSLGDQLIVLINLSEISGVNLEVCLSQAYNEIKDRKGKMINGTFVKGKENE